MTKQWLELFQRRNEPRLQALDFCYLFTQGTKCASNLCWDRWQGWQDVQELSPVILCRLRMSLQLAKWNFITTKHGCSRSLRDCNCSSVRKEALKCILICEVINLSHSALMARTLTYFPNYMALSKVKSLSITMKPT